MGTFSATANSSSTIGYAQYGSSSWSTGSSSGACQGAYQGTTAAKSRVGVMVFSGAGAALKGKLIQSITLTITSSGAGSGSSSKKLTFCQANYQSLNTGVRGSAQVGATMGTLTGKFEYCHAYIKCFQQRRAVCGDEGILRGGQFGSGAVQRRNVIQQRLFQQLRSRYLLHAHRDLHRRSGLVPGRRHMAAMHGLVPAERRVGAGGSLLQFGRRMGARLTEVMFFERNV